MALSSIQDCNHFWHFQIPPSPDRPLREDRGTWIPLPTQVAFWAALPEGRAEEQRGFKKEGQQHDGWAKRTGDVRRLKTGSPIKAFKVASPQDLAT